MAMRRRRVWIGLGAGLIGALIPLAVVYACTPSATVSVNPVYAAPGSQVAVKIGQTFSSAHVVLSLPGNEVVWSGSSSADPDGVASVTVPETVPAWAPGTYDFTATITSPAYPGDVVVRKGAFAITPLAPDASGQNNGPTPVHASGSQGSVTGVNGAIALPQGSASSPSVAQGDAPVAASGPVSDVWSRVVARDGAAPVAAVSGSGQTAGQDNELPVISPKDSSPDNSALTGLAIGAMTLAIGMPIVFAGFATATAVQRRAARAASRKRVE